MGTFEMGMPGGIYGAKPMDGNDEKRHRLSREAATREAYEELPISTEEKRRELIREIAIREGYYARLATQVPKRKEELQHRIEVMKAILADYQPDREGK